MTNPIVEVTRTALLSMDLQSAIVAHYTKGQEDFLPRVAGVLKAARDRKILTIHVQVGFRPGLPEISSRNQIFGAIKDSSQWQQVFQGDAGAIHPAVAPQPGEIVVTKHRISAFTGTDFDMILRANNIETLVLFGIVTSGVVLATLLQACDADYRVIVVKDCCVDQDAEVHGALVGKVFPRLATILDAAEFADSLRES